MKPYEKNLPPKVRIKLMRTDKAEAIDLEVGEEGLLPPQILKAMDEADETYAKRKKQVEENYGLTPKQAEEYVWTMPEPAAAELPKEQFSKLITLLEEKGLREISEKPITVKRAGKTYLLTIEYPCG